eukprot:scaffold1947_cov65-Phaeocystis_antarctica.AAC.4
MGIMTLLFLDRGAHAAARGALEGDGRRLDRESLQYINLHEVALETRAMRLRARGLRQQIFEFAARLRNSAQRAQSAHTAPKSGQHPMQRPLLLARRGRRRGRVGEHTSPVGEHHLRERRARAKERLSV